MEHVRRKGWIAGLANFVFPGLGDMYAGFFKRGVVVFVASILLAFGAMFLMLQGPMFMIAAIVIGLIVRIAFIFDGYFMARQANTERRILRRFNRWYIYVVFILLQIIVAVLMEDTVIQSWRVPSSSMVPTVLPGDHVLSRTFPFEPQRGDLVVFTRPDEFSDTLFLKRVIGMPGDKIRVTGYTFTIEGQQVERENKGPYIYVGASGETASAILWSESFGDKSYKVLIAKNDPLSNNPKEIQVPEDSYFLIGDNRTASLDSRIYGPVPKENIRAKALYFYYPFSKLGEVLTD